MTKKRTALIHSYVEEELREAVAAMAKNQNETMSNWVRKALIRELNVVGMLPKEVLLQMVS